MKKYFKMLVVAMMAFLLLSVSVGAVTLVGDGRKTTLPVTLVHDYYGHDLAVRIDSFKVESVSEESSSKLEIAYSLEYTEVKGYAPQKYIVANILDETGRRLDTVSLSTGGRFIVSRDVAAIEVAAEKPTSGSQSYIYKGEAVELYSNDGRVMKTTTLRAPAYKAVGWKAPEPVVEQKTALPVILGYNYRDKATSNIRIDEFNVTNIGLDRNYYNLLRVDYEIKWTILKGNSPQNFMIVKCYDENGIFIESHKLWPKDHHLYMSRETATFEIISENPTNNSQSYLYRNCIDVYSDDGRTLRITDLQIPAYEQVGWRGMVTMYAQEDGVFSRTIEVPPYEVEAYEKVGWYTGEGKIMYQLRGWCDEYVKNQDYDSALDMASIALYSLSGTKYEQEIYELRTDLLNRWRRLCGGKPMGLISYEIDENSIGTPEVTLTFRNLTFKKIVAYKVKFDCYNVFGGREQSYYSYFYDDDADMDIVEKSSATWTLYGANSVHAVKNIRPVEVVFADGTKWYGK